MNSSVYAEVIPSTDPRLTRQILLDERSREWPLTLVGSPAVDKSTWRSSTVRIYDPTPNPNQTVGNCTTCSKAMQLNSHGNRKQGVRLDMPWALEAYVWETHNDSFQGAWNLDGSGQDTGSSGLYACETAQHLGVGGDYYWVFGGADEVVQNVVDGRAISVGTKWYNDMFTLGKGNRVTVGGSLAGGHQWTVHGYNADRDLLKGRCWWGPEFRDFWIARGDLDALLKDNGDAHWQARA